ncbi:putative hydrolase of the HAD superfamily [Mariniphaga anaerophila]|uniref:Putative hydrolase of the HAD superfamily n=1 Tax=Mariniphaga anaerophila TaxID=1484053 RepID=A0A1M4VQ03_9BACT|nr:YjjG family noncanonical pyrimidine nucleotidase [Mariniphaga anaerophila]SHE71134.1 putative hydrolase of the HAD superfamily [Mariniphaga anaerophila]
MLKKKYTHLFFDLDNTLWDFEKNSFYAMQNTFSHFHLEKQGVDFEDFFRVYSKHNDHLWSEYRKGNVIKRDLKLLRFQLTFDELLLSGIAPDEMSSFYLTEMPLQKRLVSGAIELLDYLKAKSYNLAIITNGFSEVQLKKTEQTGLSKYFSKIYISENVKCPKPLPGIFEHAIKSSNAPKKSSLMIGDDFQTDIIGALRYGIDAVWLNPSGDNLETKLIEKKIQTPQAYSVCLLNELRHIL